jgi:DNA-binding CsgD family transcriptional regulator
VLDDLLGGKSVKLIADRLSVSRASIERDIQVLYRRFGVHGRAELLAVARQERVPPDRRRALEGLSPRERQTVSLLLTGLPERDVACILGVSFHTLHQYVKNTYRKLGLRSRPELMASLGGATRFIEDA